MIKIIFKVWIVALALFFGSHLLFTEYVKRSVQKSLHANGYSYVTVKSASLPFDTLIRTESEGVLRASMDDREIMVKFYIAGNPIVSRQMAVNVAMPMGRLRFSFW
jgi:hypothetical protein